MTDPLTTEIPVGLCQCGCGQRTTLAGQNWRTRGIAKGEPFRFLIGHGGRQSGEDFRETPDTNCWEWQLALTKKGYPRCRRKGKDKPAHRMYYEDFIGPIPEGLEIDHLCRNPRCVNPGHLEAVTHRENMARGFFAVATHCVNGHPWDEANTRIYKGKRKCRACGRERNWRVRGRPKYLREA